ncbi:hypothetical protein [Pseudothermotoga sp.]|uniref:hypothetical protein n=1 Tax=Pseudothermotoga sp. TaxID=2033661 RepID=UPI0031F6FE1C
MLLAIILILAGTALIVFGARVFFGILFLAAGIYLIVTLSKIALRARKRQKSELFFLKEQLKGKIDEEDLEWLESFFTAPVGRKIIVWIKEGKKGINIKISIPISLILLVRPFLNSFSSLFIKHLCKKSGSSLSENEVRSILTLVNSCLDELFTYKGDFVHIETEDTTVKIGVV